MTSEIPKLQFVQRFTTLRAWPVCLVVVVLDCASWEYINHCRFVFWGISFVTSLLWTVGGVHLPALSTPLGGATVVGKECRTVKTVQKLKTDVRLRI